MASSSPTTATTKAVVTVVLMDQSNEDGDGMRGDTNNSAECRCCAECHCRCQCCVALSSFFHRFLRGCPPLLFVLYCLNSFIESFPLLSLIHI